MALDLLLCGIGFLLLYFGAEWLVRGSSSLARALGISPLVIGLTVVAFGTSAPELVVSLVSALDGNTMIAVGNVLGSNICNIALVLGLAALFHPIVAHASVKRRDIPIMLGITLIVFYFCLDGTLSRLEGSVLVGGIVLYTIMNYILAKRGAVPPEDVQDGIGDVRSRPMQILLVAAGIIAVTGGGHLVKNSAINVMHVLGVSESFIGLTLVAFGTSLPELATSVVAALRGEMDISIGNLVGSNVFNLLMVLGTVSLVDPIVIPGGIEAQGLDVVFKIVFVTSALPLFMLLTRNTIRRWHGGVLLAFYGLYLAYLVNRG